MGTFLVRRLSQSIPVLFGISILMFTLVHILPGGPLALYRNQPGVTAAQLHQVAVNLGLTAPLYVQYWHWLVGALHGNFGYSYIYGLPATQMMLQRLPATLELMGAAFLLATSIAFVIGVYSAVHYRSKWDHLFTTLSYVGIAVPAFWFGLLLIILFSVDLHWLPSGGILSSGQPFSIADALRHLILPATVLAFYIVAQESRYVRAAMLDVLNQDYIRTARAKGVGEHVVIWKHALRNALLPVITVMVLDTAYLFGGSVVVETIFSWPGMGRLFIQALSQGDYPVLLVIVSFLSVVIVFANILADILYAVLDPRIRVLYQ